MEAELPAFVPKQSFGGGEGGVALLLPDVIDFICDI